LYTTRISKLEDPCGKDQVEYPFSHMTCWLDEDTIEQKVELFTLSLQGHEYLDSTDLFGFHVASEIEDLLDENQWDLLYEDDFWDLSNALDDSEEIIWTYPITLSTFTHVDKWWVLRQSLFKDRYVSPETLQERHGTLYQPKHLQKKYETL
ncbi:MAG: hypothetical protein AAGM67_10435, partial [Bacteroidota bacterium]